ncbi:MAG: hypothetical protein LUQ44_02840 [Methanothrix sp.]|nr:hypothetical protein [Methanothrix sp.]
MDSDRRLLVIVAIALAFATIPGAYGNNSSEGSVISESDNTASSDSGTSAKGWMDETIVSFLSGVVVALIVSISGNYVTYRVAKKTIDLELDKMHEQERQKEVDKRQQVYSKLRGLIFVVEQLTVIQGVGVMYIGYYTTKYKFSREKLDIDKVEKWRTDINKNLLDLAKCNQMLWEAIGSAELLFPKIEIADFRKTLFESAKILEPFFQSKKK